MAPSVDRTHLHAERGLARHNNAKRSSLLVRDSASSTAQLSAATVSASPVPSQSSVSGVTLPPEGVGALVGIIVMLCTFILGFAAWRVWVYRRDKKATDLAASRGARKHVGLYDSVYEKRKLSSGSLSVHPLTLPKLVVTRERTAADVKANLGYEPKVIYAAFEEKAGFDSYVPGIIVSPSPPSLQISPPPLYTVVAKPPLSPRTAASKAPGTNPPPATSRLPRLVVVESTFSPTLHDELVIRKGEILRLLEEYVDEWCLVQRVGPKDAEKGVVPRFCIVDKPEVLPRPQSKHVPRFQTTTKI